MAPPAKTEMATPSANFSGLMVFFPLRTDHSHRNPPPLFKQEAESSSHKQRRPREGAGDAWILLHVADC
jgi:hypothetical protein